MEKPVSVALPASFVRFLYTHNPFYLIGTLLVLYGAQLSLGEEPSLATSKLLMKLLLGYTIALALIAVFIIRCGKIWDDARTILLVIVLMFFMLSTSMDFHFLFTLEAPWPGTWLIGAGWLFSIAISEGLLLILGIRLGTSYRLAYHLMLALLFGYPTLLGWMNHHSYYSSLPWALLAFPVAGAAVLLTLLPAAGTPRHLQRETGTPWPWPYFPWSLFFFLTLGIGIRAWWLTISFQPAKESFTIFGLYFLLPLVLAWAALVLQMGIGGHSPFMISMGMVLPLLGLAIGFPGPGQNATEIEFLNELSAQLGSPPQLMAWALLGFYGWVWLRGVSASEGFLIGAGLLASVIGVETLGVASLSSPQPFVLAVIAGALLGRAIYFNSTWRAALGGLLAIAAVRYSGLGFSGNEWLVQSAWFWRWHAPLIAFLLLPAILNDPAARVIREISWVLVPALAAISAVLYPWVFPQVPTSHIVGYGLLLFITAVALWMRQRRVGPLAAALFTLGVNPLTYLRTLAFLLQQTPLASGLPWLASGFAMVLFALTISSLKMGLWQRAWQCVQQINAALGSRRFEGVDH